MMSLFICAGFLTFALVGIGFETENTESFLEIGTRVTD
jgi:hypothetical protein